jgi:hypothetical protein
MRLPRKVTISGKVYTVKRDRKKCTGWGRGYLYKSLIVVGSNGDPEQAYETFTHEVMEVALLENDLRYCRDGTNDFNYQMTHTEFDRLARDLAKAFRPMMNE